MRDYPSLFRLDEKVAVVFGAASGIGRSASLGLAAFGALVCCADLDGEGAEGTAREIAAQGGRGESRHVDLRNPSSLRVFLTDVRARHDRLDVVVATPATNARKPLLDYTDEECDRVVDLNLKGTIRVLREAGKIMAADGRGSIILLSSIRSQVVEPGQGVYAATKAGIVQLAKTLAAELGSRGVRVNALAPFGNLPRSTSPIFPNPTSENQRATCRSGNLSKHVSA